MQRQYVRKRSVCQQTAALLWKNIILKWRMRMQSFQEWFSLLIFFTIMFLSPFEIFSPDVHEIPHAVLGKPLFNITGVKIVYAPDTKMAREIMKKIETLSPLKGIETEVMEDEKAMEAAQKKDPEAVGVIFQDDISYRLRFPLYKTITPNKDLALIDTCYNYSEHYCDNPAYWTQGFVSLQSCIDSALIELITNHSVWKEMTSINGIRMRSPSVTLGIELEHGLFLWIISLCFSPFMYFLGLTVSREKRKLKEMMNSMGLRDAAFWLSWGLLYTMYISVPTTVLSFCLKATYFHLSSNSALFLLFFLYGTSSICFCFMLICLLKKPRITSFVIFISIFCFGALIVTTTTRMIPPTLELLLSIFCPFAFGAGLSKALYFQKYGRIFDLSVLMFEPYGYFLFFDSVLYMLLAFYFDKIVPDKYGVPHPPLFFLKKTYWFKSKSPYVDDAPTNERSHGNIFSDNAEPLPPEFDGKEAIRLNNIKKIYKMKSTETEALKGLSLDIYEGQITAILGHSGAGKTTLINILSGLSKPSDGSASIFKYNVSEKEHMEKIWEISALCPQSNIQFEFLTVKENLKTFAKIKGIPSNAVENEVEKLLTLLDIEAIQNTQANNLSGGQKRKLSLGITFLGEPQVLLLDEPTAGLDPYSRHQVWAFLNERKADRVILFATQLVDEADIFSDRKAIISHGRLQCVGSSLFLKKKWGIGYHLRMHTNEFCDSERITSLVKHYIPAAEKSGQRENVLSYTLPLQSVDTFSGLFSDMDHQTDLGVINYGVTMTTLEDVFLKLEGNENMKEEDYGILHGEEAKEKEEMEQDQLLLSDTGKVTMKGTELWRQQVCAVARMHFLNLKRQSKLWAALLLLSGAILAPYIIYFINYSVWLSLQYEEMHPGLYFEPGKEFFMGTSGLLILNNTGGNIDNFIKALKSQNILMDVISGNNVSDQLVHNGAIRVDLEDKKYRFTFMCHMEITNCFPVLVNIISNAFLHMFNSTAHLRTWNHVFIRFNLNDDLWFFMEIYLIAASFVLPAFPPQFAMTSIQDYEIRTRSQLRTSGLFPSAYWCGQALVDMPLHCILLLLVLWPLFLKLGVADPRFIPSLIICLVAFFLGYSISIVLFLYITAFVFRQKKHTTSFWSVISILVVLVLTVISFITEDYIRNALNVFVPMFPVTSFILSFTMLLRSSYIDDVFCVAEHGNQLKNALFELTMQPSLPAVFARKHYVGGFDQTQKAYREGAFLKLLEGNRQTVQPSYDYDLIVIGGGSGGLAASKEAAKLGKNVLVLDFVVPTPLGTRWGLGGTCVNVGCIPKKLMHQTALLGQAIKDAPTFGWQLDYKTIKHSWSSLTEAVQNYIGSLNWGYRVALRENNVTYENAYGEFIGPHKIKTTNNKGIQKIYTAERFLIATGERPRYLNIPGDKEYCITSDDLFSLPYCPEKTLVVGASYVALECAGFLAGLGLDVTVMVRSILLRGFDQDMANKIGEHMEEHGIKFIRKYVPIKIEQIEEGAPRLLKVTAYSAEYSKIIEGEYNTVLLAIGRDACTRSIGLQKVGVKINEKTGKIPVNDEEQTNVPYIYAIGDVLEGKPELTPVAIQAGRLLVRRLYGGADTKCDYINVPTTVFTPLEYGACGYSEEKAIERFGDDNIEVYHSYFWPLEWTVPSRDNNKCYAKVICNIADKERVIGFHVLGPNAGEITQGFAAAMKCGMTKEQLDSTVGIHPVCAEIFTTLSVTKRSGGDILQSGC